MSHSPAHLSGDQRFALLEAALKRHQHQQDALIEVLHVAQQLFGFLAVDVLTFVARQLKLPPSKVYGAATFYHLFTLQPPGQHRCTICTGTACYVKGADAIVEEVERAASIRVGQTTADGKLSLLTARCVGSCGVAPLAVLDEDTRGNLTPAALCEQVKGWL
jgi:bidirectional [NiFe] hydrogenase diaphorase subunit